MMGEVNPQDAFFYHISLETFVPEQEVLHPTVRDVAVEVDLLRIKQTPSTVFQRLFGRDAGKRLVLTHHGNRSLSITVRSSWAT